MKLNRIEFLLMNNPIRTFIQERYELPLLTKGLATRKYDSVLEIGCGNGHGTKLIRKYFDIHNLTAIDLDEKMIAIAKEKDPDSSTIYTVMDASNLTFPDQSFDAIFDFGIIHHIPNWKDCINELKRVLMKDGKLILEDLSSDTFTGFPGFLWKSMLLHPYEHMYSTKEFIQHLEKSGFAIDYFKESNPLGMIKHFSLAASLR